MKNSSFLIATVAFAAFASASPIPQGGGASGAPSGPTNEGNTGQVASNQGVTSGNAQVGTFGNGDNDFSGSGDSSTDIFGGIFRRQKDGSTNEGNSGQIASNQGAVTGGKGDTQVGAFGNGDNDFSNNNNKDTKVDFAGIFRRQSDTSENEGNSGQIASNKGAVTGGKGDTQVGAFGNGNDDFSNNGNTDTKVDFAGIFRRQSGDSSENEGNSGQIASNSGAVTGGKGDTQVGDFGNGNDDFSHDGNTDTKVDFAGIFKRQNDGSINEGNSGQIASNTGAVTGGSGKGATQVGDFGNGNDDFSNNGNTDTKVDFAGIFKRQNDGSINEGNSGQIASNSGAVSGGSGQGATQVGAFGNGDNDFSNNNDAKTDFTADVAFFKRQSTGGLSDGSTNEGNSGQIASNKGDVTGGSGKGATQVGAFGNGNDDFSNNDDSSFKGDFGIFKRQDSSTNKNNNGQIASNSGAVTGGAGGPTQVGNFGNNNGKPAGPLPPAASGPGGPAQPPKDDVKPAPPAPSQTATSGSCTQGSTDDNNGQVAKDSGAITDNGGIVINGNVGGSVTIIELTGVDGTKYTPPVGPQYTAPTPLTTGKWNAVTIPTGHHCMLHSDSDGGVYSFGEGNHSFPKTVSLTAAKCM